MPPNESTQPDRAAPDPPTPRDLGDATASGIRWVGSSRLVAEGAAFAALVANSHLLNPADFGRAAIALLLNELAQGVGTQGIATPLIQRRTLDGRDTSAALMLAGLTGAALTGLVGLFSLSVAPLVFDHETARFLLVAAPTFFVVAVTGVPLGLLQRDLDFRSVSIVEALAGALGSAASVGLALAGTGGVALILGMVVTTVVMLIGLLFARPVPRPAWDRERSAAIARVGGPATASGLLYFGSRNVDYALVGARLGATPLGLYSRAFRLGVDYQGKISTIMLRLALPVFSRTRDMDHLRRVRRRMVRTHALVLFPPLVLLMVLAPTAVPFLFGDQWAGAVAPTQILAVSGMAAVIMTGTGPLMYALNRPRAMFVWSLVAFVIFATAIAIACSYGIVAVAAASAGVQVGLAIAAQYFLLKRVAGVPLRETFLGDLAPPILACLPLAAVAWAAAALLGSAIPAVVTISVATPLGLVTYLGTLYFCFVAGYADLVELLARLVPRWSVPPPRKPVSDAP